MLVLRRGRLSRTKAVHLKTPRMLNLCLQERRYG